MSWRPSLWSSVEVAAFRRRLLPALRMTSCATVPGRHLESYQSLQLFGGLPRSHRDEWPLPFGVVLGGFQPFRDTRRQPHRGRCGDLRSAKDDVHGEKTLVWIHCQDETAAPAEAKRPSVSLAVHEVELALESVGFRQVRFQVVPSRTCSGQGSTNACAVRYPRAVHEAAVKRASHGSRSHTMTKSFDSGPNSRSS